MDLENRSRAKPVLSEVEGTPAKENPKSEYRKRPRGPKQSLGQTMLNSDKFKTQIRTELVLEFGFLVH